MTVTKTIWLCLFLCFAASARAVDDAEKHTCRRPGKAFEHLDIGKVLAPFSNGSPRWCLTPNLPSPPHRRQFGRRSHNSLAPMLKKPRRCRFLPAALCAATEFLRPLFVVQRPWTCHFFAPLVLTSGLVGKLGCGRVGRSSRLYRTDPILWLAAGLEQALCNSEANSSAACCDKRDFASYA